MPISVKRPPEFPAVLGPLRALITATLAVEGLRAGDITVVLADDETLRDLNRRWRGIDRATDVLSFGYNGTANAAKRRSGTRGARARGAAGTGSRRGPGGGATVEGDLVISIDRLRAQARRYRVTAGRELARLAIHGTLHLAGHDHHRGAERATMRVRERRMMRESAATLARLDRLLRPPRSRR
jgi:probable rRNA maturation factor